MARISSLFRAMPVFEPASRLRMRGGTRLAKTARTIGAAVMAAMVLTAARPVAAAESTLMIAVLLEDLYGVTIQSLGEAQHEAARIYAAIGVSLGWVSKGADPDIPEGAMWLDVALLSQSRTEALLGLTRVPKSALGLAPTDKVRVYIFCERIARLASTRESFETTLGRVLAHEIGHQLLPSMGHSDRGIMRSALNFRSQKPPAFTKAQADAIRAHLVPSRAAR